MYGMSESISRVVLLDQHLPAPLPVQRVEVRRISIEPHTALGAHVHNGPVVGSILDGSVTYQIEGQPASVLRAGDVFYEPEEERIARFDAGEDGVTFLAYFLLSPGQEPQIKG